MCLCVGRETFKSLEKTVEDIYKVFSKTKYFGKFEIVFTTDDYTPIESYNFVIKLSKKYKKVISNHKLIKNKKLTFARSYLSGFERAVADGVDYVIEMDVAMHDPNKIPIFLKGLIEEKCDCVFSTRFSRGGGFKNLPIQRVIISKIGTSLSNVFFGIYPPLSDLTSGYEAFSSKFLKQLFSKSDIEKWVSVTIVPHLVQTELRVLSLKLGAKYKMVPVKYGNAKKGNKLKLRYLYKALKGFTFMVFRFYTGRYWTEGV
ncbi:MAG: Glycosyl transferase GT2 family [Candidatus Woesebacteria bacterium GW2011_GWA1_43_12]|uniref:Glycosyl transferase GT2 family n=1 Tax=Candidatus Woesebacteria bacterium GW2011_GWA1_43_12 TaxID=1618557 RepID=A0A0G1F6J8_9BACT|nr:MAG: Glycosyl transferase GT2 family [Candidatus Woesebacteria bacterium GW2011_GWA1_43_12]